MSLVRSRICTRGLFGHNIKEKISVGQARISVITKKDLTKMIDEKRIYDLESIRYVFVSDSVKSKDGQIKIINAFSGRKYLKEVIKKIKERYPDSFYIVEHLKMINKELKKRNHLLYSKKRS